MTVSVRNISGRDLVVPLTDGSTVLVLAGNSYGFPDAIGNGLLLQTSTWQPGGAATAVSLVVQPNGNTSITVKVSGSVSLFTDVGLSVPAVFPATITTNTTYYASVYGLQTLTVSLKDSLGYEHYLSGTAVLDPANPTTTVSASVPAGASTSIDKPGVYIPTGSLPTLKVAIKQTASQLVEVVYFGDSTGFGSGGDGGPVRKLRSVALAAGLTDGGRGVASPNETSSSSGETLAPLVSKTGFGASGNQSDYLNSDTPVSSAASDVITFTGKGTCLRIVYTILQGTTGRFTYAVDGGSAVTVDASTATDGATTASVGVVYVSGLTEGTHTVVITNLANSPVSAASIAPVVSVSNSGGTLAAGTYFYKTTAVTGSGETTASPASGGNGTAGGSGSGSITPARVPGATSYNVYRATSSGGTYGLVGNVAASGGGTYNGTAFSDTGFAAGVAPPGTNTAGFTGTTQQCRAVTEWIRTAGVVFHKQTISGISTSSFFDSTRSATAGQPNVPAQVALGLATGVGGPNSTDWGRSPATKPTARNVKAAIFALGLNDSNAASETAFQASLVTAQQGFALFVKMCRAAGADPILVIEHFDYYGNAVSNLYGDRLRTALTFMARSYGVPYVDYNVALGPVNTGPYAGAPHLVQSAYDTEGSYLWNELFAKALAGTAG